MLKYIGKGGFILQVPARDITEDEIEGLQQRFGWKNLRKTLLDSGLYEEEAPEEVPEETPKVSRKRKKEVS